MNYRSALLLVFSFLISTLHAQVPEMTENTNTVMGMVLLNEMELMDYPGIEEEILQTWDISRDELNGNDQRISFTIDGATFLIGLIPTAVPGDDLSAAVEYTYLWKDARSALDTKAHIMIAVVGERSQLDLYQHFSDMSSILLRHTNSSGVFHREQLLLLSKEYYLQEASKANDEQLPVNLWVYFGRKQTDEGNSAYTYGLQEFGLNEMEIVRADQPTSSLIATLQAAAQQVLRQDTQLEDGAELELPGDKKVKVSLSNGENLDGQTLKLVY